MRRDLGDPWGIAGSLLNLGLVAIQRGDLAKASDSIGEATVGFTKVGDRLGVCRSRGLAGREGRKTLRAPDLEHPSGLSDATA